jgi:hypothetical protein
LFSGDEGILETPTYADWLAIVAVMTASTAIAVIASIRGLRALSIGHASSSRL